MTDRHRYRLRFAKRGRLRFVSHRDLLLVFERALRRAGLRVSHTEGFNPHPRLTFAQALPLGVESLDEVVDVELVDSPEPTELLGRLGAALPPELEVLGCDRMEGRKAPQPAGAEYRVPVDGDAAGAALARWRDCDNPLVVREHKGRRREIRLADHVRGLEYRDGALCFTLTLIDGSGVKPGELLEWLGLDAVRLRATKVRTLLAGEGTDNPVPGA